MKYTRTTPCENCPFRSDIPPFLRPERVKEIRDALVRGGFSCHKSLDYSQVEDADDQPDEEHAVHCAGALILLEKIDKPSQMMRICERIGLYDRSKLDMKAPVFDSFEDMIAAQRRSPYAGEACPEGRHKARPNRPTRQSHRPQRRRGGTRSRSSPGRRSR